MKTEKLRYNPSELRYCDIIVGITFVLMLVARITTLFYISMVATETGADIESIITLYEASPLHKLLLNLTQSLLILQIFIIPTLALTIYLLFRRRLKTAKLNIETLWFFITFIFFVILMDILNNLALLLGRMI